MKKFIINEDVLTGLVKYLYQRPYQEVVGLIQAIGQLPDYKEPPEPVEVEPKV